MNRQQAISQTLLWESVAAKAKERASAIRQQLTQDAHAEFDEQGTAPTWRLPDVGTVTLPVSQETVYVADEKALIRWIRSHPMAESSVWMESAVETVERVRHSFVEALAAECQVDDGVVSHLGDVVSGLAVRPGGVPLALSFRPTRDARAFAGDMADKWLSEVEQHIGGGS